MISLQDFLGSILSETTLARTIADKTSLQLSKEYLEDDILKHMPIPRMRIGEMELNLKFALGNSLEITSFKKDMRTELLKEIQDFLINFASQPIVKPLFDNSKRLSKDWNRTVLSIVSSISKAYPEKISVNASSLIHIFSSIIEGEFLRLALRDENSGVFSIIKKLFHSEILEDSRTKSEIEAFIRNKVENIVLKIISKDEDFDVPLNILVEAAELEKIPCEKVHELKINIHSSDRQLVTVEHDGEFKPKLSPI